MRRLICALLVVAAGVIGCSHESAPSSKPPSAPTQSVLPFTGLNGPYDVAVDAAGNVFVTDIAKGRNGSNQVTKGAVYVVEGQQHQILKLDPGSTTPTVLPFSGLTRPVSVAIGPRGEVYVVDDADGRVVKLEGI